MDGQQLIALAIVGAAALYLGRGFIVSARNFFSRQGGCGGCGKCSFAAREHAGGQPPNSPPKLTIIPLMDANARKPSK
jgi:hypothetical protein